MAPNNEQQFDLDEAKRQWDSGNPKVVDGVFEELRRLRSTLGARVIKNLTEKIIEAERQRDAAVAKLMPGIKKMEVDGAGMTFDLDDTHQLVGRIAKALSDLLDREGGPNYAEMHFKEAGRVEPLVVAVARSQAQTPHELRRKAEAEAERGRAAEVAACLRAERAESERDELLAARLAFASEFPPSADGDPDIGSVHENIRKLKAECAQLRRLCVKLPYNIEEVRLRKESVQQRTLLTTMRQSCLAWFDNPNGPWGWECVACGAQFTKSAGPGQPPSETRAYAEVVHDADCVFHPTPRLPSSSDGDLP